MVISQRKIWSYYKEKKRKYEQVYRDLMRKTISKFEKVQEKVIMTRKT